MQGLFLHDRDCFIITVKIRGFIAVFSEENPIEAKQWCKELNMCSFWRMGLWAKPSATHLKLKLLKVAWKYSCRFYGCFQHIWAMWGPPPDLQNCARSSQLVELYGLPPRQFSRRFLQHPFTSLDKK